MFTDIIVPLSSSVHLQSYNAQGFDKLKMIILRSAFTIILLVLQGIPKEDTVFSLTCLIGWVEKLKNGLFNMPDSNFHGT